MNNEPSNNGTSNISDYTDLPPIKARDKTENQNDSLLIIDGRSYTIQPQVVRLIRVYYHDHELFCDTRTKEVFIDKKRVYRMGETTKEVVLNGRKVRLMYMGKRIEVWIDGKRRLTNLCFEFGQLECENLYSVVYCKVYRFIFEQTRPQS